MSVLIGLTASAQVSYGPKIGVNISSINVTSKSFKTSVKPGLYFGGFVNYALNPRASFRGELFYSMEGTKEISNINSGKINSGYLTLPVLFRYTAASGIFAEAGPQISFLLSNKEKWNGSTNNIKPYYKSSEFRFPIGIGYHFSNSLQGLSANARYSAGFSPINKVEVGAGDLKNRTFSIGFEYNLAK